MKRLNFNGFVCTSVALAFFIAAHVGSACNVPVFRYALEKWDPEKYDIFVFHNGPLSKKHRAAVDALQKYLNSEKCVTNANLLDINLADKEAMRQADLAANALGFMASPTGLGSYAALGSLSVRNTGRDPFVELFEFEQERHKSQISFPYVIIRYPYSRRIPQHAWAGPFDADLLERFLDSPARQEVAKRILKGETAVWLFVESGHKKKDERAFQLLQDELKRMPDVLKLPELTDQPEDKISESGPKLKIDFSLVKLSRDDPKEKMLIEMLTHMEDDLHKYSDEPMVFPIFGRGVVLYALIGLGINKENVEIAGSQIVAPCTCTVKKENPWVDIVMTRDWEGELTGRLVKDHPLPDLTGLFATPVETQPKTEIPAPTESASDVSTEPTTKTPTPRADTMPGSNFTLYRNIGLAVGGVVIVLVGATLVMLMRNKNGIK